MPRIVYGVWASVDDRYNAFLKCNDTIVTFVNKTDADKIAETAGAWGTKGESKPIVVLESLQAYTDWEAAEKRKAAISRIPESDRRLLGL